MPYGQPDLLYLHGVVAPTRLQAGLDGCIDGHCQIGNLAYSAAVSMDWLDELFDKA